MKKSNPKDKINTWLGKTITLAVLVLVIIVMGTIAYQVGGSENTRQLFYVLRDNITGLGLVITLLIGVYFYLKGVPLGIFQSTTTYVSNEGPGEREVRKQIQEILGEKAFETADGMSKEEINHLISKRLDSLVDKDIYDRIADKFSKELKGESKREILYSLLRGSAHRMASETRRLSRNSLVNLMLGIITTVIAIAILYSTLDVLRGVDPKATASLVALMGPRLSLAALVEIFSFFFLKLYRVNLEDIKSLNNEITNLEMKWVAVELSSYDDNTDEAKKVVAILASTERNFVLNKGQSTIGLETVKMENATFDKLVDKLTSAIGKKA